MKEDAKFHIGIKALITNENGEILLLKAGPSEKKYTKCEFWDLPGGRIKVGDDIEKTLRREVHEELGVPENSIKLEGLFDATISNFKASHGENLFLMLLVYRCKLLNDREFKLSDEHSEYKWTTVDEAKKLLDVKYQKGFLEKLDELKSFKD